MPEQHKSSTGAHATTHRSPTKKADEEVEKSEEATETSKELEVREGEEEAPLIDPPRTYSPYELPADPFAAQAFMDAHPEMVDTEAKLEPQERQDLAEENIQTAVDAHAERGVTVEDPRLAGSDVLDRREKAAKEAEKAEKEAAEEAEKETADA